MRRRAIWIPLKAITPLPPASISTLTTSGVARCSMERKSHQHSKNLLFNCLSLLHQPL